MHLEEDREGETRSSSRIDARRSRAAAPKAGPDRKKIVVGLGLLVIPLFAGLWFLVIKDLDTSEIRSSSLDPYGQQSDPNAGLMTAAGPAQEEASKQEPEMVSARSEPASPAPTSTERVEVETDPLVSGLLQDALRSKDELVAENSRLAAEVANLKSSLASAQTELRMTKGSNDRQVKSLEKQLRDLQATMNAEIAKARAEAMNGVMSEPEMSEAERERLRELREFERRRLRKSGVVMDEAPKEGI